MGKLFNVCTISDQAAPVCAFSVSIPDAAEAKSRSDSIASDLSKPLKVNLVYEEVDASQASVPQTHVQSI